MDNKSITLSILADAHAKARRAEARAKKVANGRSGKHKHDKYPTLHALGLGPALDEIERVCAIGQAGKYAGQPLDQRTEIHMQHAEEHVRNVFERGIKSLDAETGRPELAHAATRLLMALSVVKKVSKERP